MRNDWKQQNHGIINKEFHYNIIEVSSIEFDNENLKLENCRLKGRFSKLSCQFHEVQSHFSGISDVLNKQH